MLQFTRRGISGKKGTNPAVISKTTRTRTRNAAEDVAAAVLLVGLSAVKPSSGT